jgi:hypothetical protein
MDERALQDLLRRQDGVVSRRQVLACGGDDDLVERRIRRREWGRVHPGVYVDHTGPLTWDQRAWAAVLLCWPAALSHDSALRAHRPDARRDPGTGAADGPIHVAIDVRRRQAEREGIRLHRVTGLDGRVQRNRTPPRVRFEEAVLQVASDASDEATAVAVIADACQSHRTTPERLVSALRGRPRLPRRRFLMALLEDVATGAYSVLEHRYLARVERPHGLPTGRRQRRVRHGRAPAYRDVDYRGFGVVVELDGRLGHEQQADRWDDLDRDIDSVVAGDVTVRVGWRQVLSPCRLAAVVGRLLAARGWSGALRACGPGCSVAPARPVRGTSPAPGAGDVPRTASDGSRSGGRA